MKTSKRILITGASGCVGQYTSYWLLKNSDAELLLWLRNPEKLTAVPKNHPRVKLLVGDLREPEAFKNELKTVTRVIHTATAWGDPERAYKVNVMSVKKLLTLLNPQVLEQIIYFSTASILNKELEPLPEALQFGTEYIQSKAICLQELEKHPLANKIIAVFPTLVFGGRVNGTSKFPTSYLTAGLKEASNWIWLARWFKADSNFHFIHAADIAFICGHLATNPFIPSQDKGPLIKLVMAQKSISINQSINEIRKWNGMIKTPQVPLWGWLIEALVRFLPLQINNWDRFSIKQRHFVHNPITHPECFGGRSYAGTLQQVLKDSGLPRKQN